VELIEDDQSTPSEAVKAAKKLIYRIKGRAYRLFSEPCTLAILDVAEAEGVPLVVPIARLRRFTAKENIDGS
jgi:ABC-type branched-subunit amino acid transport system substrate-binding protein